jgi:hypothetical protein
MPGDVNVGITPLELYYRQNGLCFLKIETDASGGCFLYCSDGNDSERTDYMCNPTQECIKCLSKFALNAFAGKLVCVDDDKETTTGDTTSE